MLTAKQAYDSQNVVRIKVADIKANHSPHFTYHITTEPVDGYLYVRVGEPWWMDTKQKYELSISTGLQYTYLWLDKGQKVFEEVNTDELLKCLKEDKQLPENAVSVRSHLISATGTDPEVFVINKLTGQIIPAFEFLTERTTKGQTDVPFWDGYQAEFTVRHGSCHEGVVCRIREGLKRVHDLAIYHNRNAELTHKCVLPVSTEGVDEKYVRLGCAPSQNIYDTKHFDIPDGRYMPFRVAGCHMHFSYSTPGSRDVRNLVRGMDQVGGTLMTLACQGLEDPQRRRMYGRAGEYRRPSYGIEWRVPSTAILAHPALTMLAFDAARFGLTLGLGGWNSLWEQTDRETQLIVNQLDIKTAKKVLKRNEKITEYFCKTNYGVAYWPKYKSILQNGWKSVGDTDLATNWQLRSAYTNSWNYRLVNYMHYQMS